MGIEGEKFGSEYLLPDLGPGFLVFLEGIDFHPALEDRHGIDPVASVDEFLKHVGEGGLTEATGFMKTS